MSISLFFTDFVSFNYEATNTWIMSYTVFWGVGVGGLVWTDMGGLSPAALGG